MLYISSENLSISLLHVTIGGVLLMQMIFLYVLLYASMTRQRFYVSKEAHQTLGALFHCLFAQLHSDTLRCENRLQQYLLVITEVLLQRLMIIQVLNIQAYALRYRRILRFKHTISLR